MTTHPEIAPMPSEERIRAIAYSLWEEEGRPDGRHLDHWLRACELVAAEAAAQPVEPAWLERKGAARTKGESRRAA